MPPPDSYPEAAEIGWYYLSPFVFKQIPPLKQTTWSRDWNPWLHFLPDILAQCSRPTSLLAIPSCCPWSLPDHGIAGFLHRLRAFRLTAVEKNNGDTGKKGLLREGMPLQPAQP